MKQNFYAGFLISLSLHFILIFFSVWVSYFQLSFIPIKSSDAIIKVYTLFEDEKIDRPIVSSFIKDQDSNSKSIKNNNIEKELLETLNPSLALENLRIRELADPLKEKINLEGYLGKISEYSNIIKKQIIDSWNQPESAKIGMSVELSISMLPTGEIVSMNLTKKSGDEVFDRSTLTAVESIDFIRGINSMPRTMFDNNFRNFLLVFIPKENDG